MDLLFKRWTYPQKQQQQQPAHDDSDDAERGDNNQEEQQDEHQQQQQQQQITTTTGSEWIFIEEPVGFFFPEMKKQRQLLELDQVRHVLHYANYKRVIQLHDISLVTSVEEVGADGGHQWWMTIQDPRMLQVWIVHFPSLLRLQLWVDLLRSVVRATGSRAIVSDVVLASELDRRLTRRSRTSTAIVGACAKQEIGDEDAGPETLETRQCEVAISVSWACNRLLVLNAPPAA